MRAADSVNMSNKTLQIKLSQQVPDKTAQKTACSLQHPTLKTCRSLPFPQKAAWFLSRTLQGIKLASQGGMAWVHTNE